MKIVKDMYEKECLKSSDINEHLPILRYYSSTVAHVTEMGTRSGRSTLALLMGAPKKMFSYDMNKFAIYNNLRADVAEITDFSFLQANVLEIEIENTDLLFIDTYHTFCQLSQELERHFDKVNKYIIFHDTQSFGEVGEDKKSPGLLQAINDFKNKHTEWRDEKILTNNNGLYILKNIISG